MDAQIPLLTQTLHLFLSVTGIPAGLLGQKALALGLLLLLENPPWCCAVRGRKGESDAADYHESPSL